MKFALFGLIIGISAGLLGALCGVGGGILMVPLFTGVLKLGQKEAIATSLAVIVLTSIAATIQNARAATPLIHWPLFAACAAGSVVASWFGAGYMKNLQNDTLTRLFAAVMIGVGLWMWISTPATAAQIPPSEQDNKKMSVEQTKP